MKWDMGRVCSTHGRDKERIYSFNWGVWKRQV